MLFFLQWGQKFARTEAELHRLVLIVELRKDVLDFISPLEKIFLAPNNLHQDHSAFPRQTFFFRSLFYSNLFVTPAHECTNSTQQRPEEYVPSYTDSRTGAHHVVSHTLPPFERPSIPRYYQRQGTPSCAHTTIINLYRFWEVQAI